MIISPEVTCRLLGFILPYCRAIRRSSLSLLELCFSGDPFLGGGSQADCGSLSTGLIEMSCGVAACSEVTGSHTVHGI